MPRTKGKTYEEIHGAKEAKRLRKVRSRAIKKRGRIWSTHPKGMLGKHHTKEWGEQHSKDISGEKHPLYKKGHSTEAKEKISRNHAPCSGEDNSNWRGGASRLPYSWEFNAELKLKVRQRNNFSCQFCPAIENGKAFLVHHINYNKQDSSQRNFTLLCPVCSGRANFEREKWEFLFTVLNEIGGKYESITFC